MCSYVQVSVMFFFLFFFKSHTPLIKHAPPTTTKCLSMKLLHIPVHVVTT